MLRKEQSVDGDRMNEELTSLINFGFSYNNWDILPFWDNDSDAVSQEISISYSGEQLEWVVGGYYLHHANFNDFLEATGAAPFSESSASLPRSQLDAPELCRRSQSDLNFTEFRTVTREDYAFYGQATYRMNDMFAVTAGVRYQDEDQLDETSRSSAFSGSARRTTNDSK